MGGAAVTEKAPLVGVGVEPRIFAAVEAGARRTVGDVGIEIERRMARLAAWREETRRVLAGGGELGEELRTHLVTGFGDTGAERADNVAAVGAEPLHRRDG